MISSPLTTIPAGSEQTLAERIARLCRERGVEQVIIGFPLSADGTEGAGCARSRRLAQRLSEQGIPCALQDESWSSRDAEDALRAVGKSRRTAREKVDAIAASLILQDYLSEKSRA
jgi:putative holliday junction resolvase